jgi:hypothetical protein
LQSIAGSGTAHISTAELAEIQRQDNVLSVVDNTTLDDSHFTIRVTTTGKTITLPAASSARLGKEWTIMLATVGYTDITSGTDTINLPTNDNTIRLTNKGASVTIRCVSATSWGIV